MITENRRIESDQCLTDMKAEECKSLLVKMHDMAMYDPQHEQWLYAAILNEHNRLEAVRELQHGLSVGHGSLEDFLNFIRGRLEGSITLKRQYDEGNKWEESERISVSIGGYRAVLEDAEFFLKENK